MSPSYGILVAAWPSFARHLAAAKHATGMAAMLSDVVGIDTSPSGASRILRDFFSDDPRLADEIAEAVAGLDHVGAIAPAGATIEDAEASLRESGFRDELRRFQSRILAADLSERLRRSIRVDVIEAWATERRGAGIGFEWFVADLPEVELRPIVRDEVGCHVALRLSAATRTEDIHAIAKRASEARIPTVVTPVRANADIGVRLFYVDRIDESGRVRRLELVSES